MTTSPGAFGAREQVRGRLFQRFSPLNRGERSFAVFTEQNIAICINCYGLAFVVELECAFSTKNQIVGCFWQRACLKRCAADSITQDTITEFVGERFRLFSAFISGFDLLINIST